eukprot:jgi/Chrzof1/13880/Cz08g15300.t1
MLSTIATPSSVKPFSGTQYVAKRVPALRSGPMRASVVTCASEDRRNKLAQAVLSTAAALALGCSSATATELPVLAIGERISSAVTDTLSNASNAGGAEAPSSAPNLTNALKDAGRQIKENTANPDSKPFGISTGPLIPSATVQTGQPGNLRNLGRAAGETFKEQTSDTAPAQAFKDQGDKAGDIDNQSGYFRAFNTGPSGPLGNDKK